MRDRRPSILLAVLVSLYLGAVSYAAFAQQIPGAPANVFSLQWFVGSSNASQYSDAGFLYPALGTQGGAGSGPLGYYFTVTDAGSPPFTTMPLDIRNGASLVGVNVTVSAGATGTLQAQESNDGTDWSNVGTLITMDGGANVYTFGASGTQSVVAPVSQALLRIEDFSTSVATVHATAVIH